MTPVQPCSPRSHDAARSPTRTRSARRWITSALTLAMLAVLVALGVTKLDLAEVGHALAYVHGGWVAVGAGLMIAAFLARAESWFAALSAALPERRIGRSAVTRALLIGMAGSAVAPGRLGEAARAWLIVRRCGEPRQTLATVVGTLLSQTLLNTVALAILGVIAIAGSAIPGAHTEAIVIAAALLPGLALALIAGPKLLGSAGAPRLRPLQGAAAWLRRRLIEVRAGLAVFGRRRSAAHSIGFQLTAWALQLGTCYTVILAFGLERRAGVAVAAAVLLAVNVTAVLPLTPANVGVFQAACIAVLAPVGVSPGHAFAYALILQGIEIASALALGLPALVHEGLSLGELRRQARRDPAIVAAA